MSMKLCNSDSDSDSVRSFVGAYPASVCNVADSDDSPQKAVTPVVVHSEEFPSATDYGDVIFGNKSKALRRYYTRC